MRPDPNGSQPTVLERTTMRRILASLATVAAVTLAGCKLDLTNPNNPTLGGALSNPRAATSRMIVGVLSTYLVNRTDQTRAFCSFGRDPYHTFLTDGRFMTGAMRDCRLDTFVDAGSKCEGR